MAKKGELTEVQKRVLQDGEPDFFNHAQVHGPGPALAALKRKGLVEGRHLTDLGAQVARSING